MVELVVVVKRLGDDDNRDKRYCLCVLSLRKSYANEHLDLPFCKAKPVDGMTCWGLVYFHDDDDNFVICNLTTRQIKLFSSPPDLLPPPNLAIFNGCGFRYDASSDDFKVLRNFGQTFFWKKWIWNGTFFSNEYICTTLFPQQWLLEEHFKCRCFYVPWEHCIYWGDRVLLLAGIPWWLLWWSCWYYGGVFHLTLHGKNSVTFICHQLAHRTMFTR